MRRWIPAVILGLVVCCGLYDRAEAEFAVVSDTSSLNLRAGPGYDYEVISTAARNEWVNIISSGAGWDYVTVIRNGKSGYMLDSYLRRASEGGSIGVVANPTATAFLNLREYPSLASKVLGIYYNSAVCRILSKETGWYHVEIDGLTGYFREEYLKVSGGSTARVTASNGKPVKLRSGPSMNYPAMTSLPVGTAVTVLMKGNGFWQISDGKSMGYMSSAFLSESADPSPPAPETAKGYLIVASPNAGKVNLRAQPSSTAKVLTQYDSGIRLEVLEGGLTWCKVYGKASGLTGYIMTRFTTVYGLPGTPVKTVSNGKSYVNLRASPNVVSGTILYKIPSGQKVTILIPGDEWSQVRYQGTDGYMMSCFLK